MKTSKNCSIFEYALALPDELLRYIIAPVAEASAGDDSEIAYSDTVGVVSKSFLSCTERISNRSVCKSFRDTVQDVQNDPHLWWIGQLKGPAARHSACMGFDKLGCVTSRGLLDPAKSIRLADKGARKALFARETELPSRLSNHLCAFTGSERPAVLVAFGFIPLDFFRRLPSPIHASLFLSDNALTALERMVPAQRFDESRFASFVVDETTPQHSLNRALWACFDEGLLEDEKDKKDAKSPQPLNSHEEGSGASSESSSSSGISSSSTSSSSTPSSTSSLLSMCTTAESGDGGGSGSGNAPPQLIATRQTNAAYPPLALSAAVPAAAAAGPRPIPVSTQGKDPNMVRLVRAREAARRPDVNKLKRPPPASARLSVSPNSNSTSWRGGASQTQTIFLGAAPAAGGGAHQLRVRTTRLFRQCEEDDEDDFMLDNFPGIVDDFALSPHPPSLLMPRSSSSSPPEQEINPSRKLSRMASAVGIGRGARVLIDVGRGSWRRGLVTAVLSEGLVVSECWRGGKSDLVPAEEVAHRLRFDLTRSAANQQRRRLHHRRRHGYHVAWGVDDGSGGGGRGPRRCEEPGCDKGARGSTSRCSAHGGGKRCEEPGCDTSARGSTGRCKAHGGGKRCEEPGCGKCARGSTGRCASHDESGKRGDTAAPAAFTSAAAAAEGSDGSFDIADIADTAAAATVMTTIAPSSSSSSSTSSSSTSSSSSTVVRCHPHLLGLGGGGGWFSEENQANVQVAAAAAAVWPELRQRSSSLCEEAGQSSHPFSQSLVLPPMDDCDECREHELDHVWREFDPFFKPRRQGNMQPPSFTRPPSSQGAAEETEEVEVVAAGVEMEGGNEEVAAIADALGTSREAAGPLVNLSEDETGPALLGPSAASDEAASKSADDDNFNFSEAAKRLWNGE